MTNAERQELYTLMGQWGRKPEILYQKVREWIEDKKAPEWAAEREAKLIADTHIQGQRDMREQIFQACDSEGYIHRSEISNQRLIPSQIAAQAEERDRRAAAEAIHNVNWLPLAKKLSAYFKAFGQEIHPNKIVLFIENELEPAHHSAVQPGGEVGTSGNDS